MAKIAEAIFARPYTFSAAKGTALGRLFGAHAKGRFSRDPTQNLQSLGTFDVVYSWGVLHHTGDLRQALENAAAPVKPGGTLFVSIYNDQGWRSQYWIAIKRAYNSSRIMRAIVLTTHLPLPFARFIVRKLRRRPLERGMSIWSDHIDWLGDYPFEVASFEAMRTFYETRGFRLTSSTRATSGCNEFVFERLQQCEVHDDPLQLSAVTVSDGAVFTIGDGR